jgi:lysozyme family protein
MWMQAMSADNCAEAIRRVLASEGGYVNHPSDPGGPTNFGITIADYRKYVKPDASAADVRAMKADEAEAIYRSKYWDVMRCDALAPGVDYCVFDYAVNSGTGRVPKVLQRALSLPVTGRMDDATIVAVGKRDPHALIAAICDERLRFLKGLETWSVFGAGWTRRVGEVRAAALTMADRPAGPAALPATPSSGKGVVPQNDAARRGAAGGAIATGGLTAQQSAASGASWATVALIILAAFILAVAVWLVLRWLRKRRQEAAA